MVVMGVVSGFAQGGVDFATYDVLVRRGDVAVVAKGEDYRMVVGNLKKPKTVFLLGKSKEEAARKIDQLVEVTAKCPKDKASRSFLFCGILLYYSAAGSDSNLQYSFQREDNKVKFVLNRDDLLAFKQVYDDK